MDNTINAIIDLHGTPNIYIGGKCNPNWEEIKSQLPKGQTVYDRPDIINNVFRNKLLNLEKFLREGRYFGGHLPVYVFFTVDFSYNKLPIFHMAVRLQNINLQDNPAVVHFIDQYIKAEVPVPFEFLSMPFRQFHMYQALVDEMMIHKCTISKNRSLGCKPSSDQRCYKGYDREDVLSSTIIDERSIVHYRRRKLCDLVIVTHNPQLLLEWNGHICVQFIANVSNVSKIINCMKLCDNKIFVKIYV